jgi:hypothetical protein
VRDLLRERDAFADGHEPVFDFYTTGDLDTFKRVASTLLRLPVANAARADL